MHKIKVAPPTNVPFYSFSTSAKNAERCCSQKWFKKIEENSINVLSSDKSNSPFVVQKPLETEQDVVAEVDPQQDVISFLKHVAEILLKSLRGIIRYEKKKWYELEWYESDQYRHI